MKKNKGERVKGVPLYREGSAKVKYLSRAIKEEERDGALSEGKETGVASAKALGNLKETSLAVMA